MVGMFAWYLVREDTICLHQLLRISVSQLLQHIATHPTTSTTSYAVSQHKPGEQYMNTTTISNTTYPSRLSLPSASLSIMSKTSS